MKSNRQIHQLRVFSPSANPADGENPRSEEHDRTSGITSPKRVSVALVDIAPVIADAVASGRGWLTDFAAETIQIDADLYEVLLAYQQMRRLDAA